MTDQAGSRNDLRATYRLQFRSGMTFDCAAELVPYLAKLGISHLYASPIFQAVPGSTHGYDVTDPNVLDPELGGEAGFSILSDALRRHGMGLLVDFVPNHMAANQHNPWWSDVLEFGRASAFASHFDIDWSAPKLILPVLGQCFGDVLSDGGFGISHNSSDNRLTFDYGPLRFPLHPATYSLVLSLVGEPEFDALAQRLEAAEAPDWPTLKQELGRVAADPAAGAALKAALEAISRDPMRLAEVHDAQIWRLTHWRLARDGLTYRRFFEITDLIGLTVDREQTFADAHRRLLELITEGRINGVRLDHIDGLRDPLAYFRRLRLAIARGGDFPVLIEKILEPGEQLPSEWPIQGTTGYEFIASVAGLLVDPAGQSKISQAYSEFTGSNVDYDGLVRDAKREILNSNLASELRQLTARALVLARRDPAARDIGPDTMRRAIVELAAAMPVYRTYVDGTGPSPHDRKLIERVASDARASGAVEFGEAFDFLERSLKLQSEPHDERELDLVQRFQQTTGPVMAKAVEDTTFYRFNRLIALNEVGGAPDNFGGTISNFHDDMLRRLSEQPDGLTATATHDTKRGEDARARIYALSEVPGYWQEAVRRWSQMNAGLRTGTGRGPSPEPATEWLFYQSLLGAWPTYLQADDRQGLASLAERMAAFMQKAVREAKLFTSWTGNDETYETAVERFARRALDRDFSAAFLDDFLTTCRPLFVAGVANSLTQTALKLMVPGVPDIYQGTEYWDLSLVDPDNRRPVDFAALGRAREVAASTEPEELVREWWTGLMKQRLILAGLRLREELPRLFHRGSYLPLQLTGPRADNAVAFARQLGSTAVVTLAPIRIAEALMQQTNPLLPPNDWSGTELVLPPDIARRRFADVITGNLLPPGNSLPCAELLRNFTIAILRAQ